MNQMAGGFNPQMLYGQDPNSIYGGIQDANILQQQMYYYMANNYYPNNYLYYQMYPQYFQQAGIPQGGIAQQAPLPGDGNPKK